MTWKLTLQWLSLDTVKILDNYTDIIWEPRHKAVFLGPLSLHWKRMNG